MLEQFITTFTECAHTAGISRLQFYVEQISEQKLHVYQAELERLQLADVTLVYVEGEYGGKLGSTFVENLQPHLFTEHIATIKQTAEYNNRPFAPRRSLALPTPHVTTDSMPISLLADQLKEAESVAYAVDERVKLVRDCSFVGKSKRIMLIDDQGGQIEDHLHYYRASIGIIAEDGNSIQTAGHSGFARSIDQLDLKALARTAANRAVSMLGAAPVKTGDYPVILLNDVVCDLLLTFLPAFYADRVQNSMSRMQGRLGQQVAATAVTLIEDPDFDQGIITRRFDDEATPTLRKQIIEDGVLRCYFHNRQTAQKADTVSTGNGFKRDYTEKPTICPTNLYLRKGDFTLTELERQMGDGLLITECDGMFAGADPVSGDFSLISKGYLISSGKVVRPVAQITVAGNFFDMLRQITGIGCDYTSGGSESGFVTAPSIQITHLSVSGE